MKLLKTHRSELPAKDFRLKRRADGAEFTREYAPRRRRFSHTHTILMRELTRRLCCSRNFEEIRNRDAAIPITEIVDVVSEKDGVIRQSI